MRKSRVAGLVFLATAALAQQQQSVEITSEPSHHLVLENEYVRVFNVIVAPRASTLVHRHNYDYLFVTLGDSDLINARVGEEPKPLQLKDGDVRFTPGHFAHAAVNKSDRPFHNITIELLKPTTHEQECMVNCSRDPVGAGTFTERLYLSDQWSVSVVTLAPREHLDYLGHRLPQLVVPVSNLEFSAQPGSTNSPIKRSPGQIDWLPTGVMHPLYNNGSETARFVVLEFNAEKPKP
jgi:quercetin dioxygenase-like cupin family protein